jgi:hypothetical protein
MSIHDRSVEDPGRSGNRGLAANGGIARDVDGGFDGGRAGHQRGP